KSERKTTDGTAVRAVPSASCSWCRSSDLVGPLVLDGHGRLGLGRGVGVGVGVGRGLVAVGLLVELGPGGLGLLGVLDRRADVVALVVVGVLAEVLLVLGGDDAALGGLLD